MRRASTRTAAPVVAFIGAALPLGCEGLPCRTNTECPVGMFCDAVARHCDYECLAATDCATPALPGRRPICTNEGRCGVAGRPPRLLVERPTPDTVFPFGTRTLTVAGRVVAETARVEITVSTQRASGCSSDALRKAVLENPTPGEPTELPFTLDDVVLDPGPTTVVVEARAGLSRQRSAIDIERLCTGCPEVVIEEPGSASLDAPVIPRLIGRVRPAPATGLRWRVVDERGQVLDGQLPVEMVGEGATFRLLDVPTFGGRNRLEVVAPVAGGVEGSCSTTVLAPPTPPRSLKAVSTWDNPTSDLDLVLIGPDATLANDRGVVSPSRRDPALPARVLDDFDGLGPEILLADPLADGAYGLAVEALADGVASGSSVVLRLMWEDRLLTPRPLGPRFLSAARGEVWIVGAVRVEDGVGRFIEVDEVVGFDSLPTRPPGDWPTLW